jgi:hypothetical protein
VRACVRSFVRACKYLCVCVFVRVLIPTSSWFDMGIVLISVANVILDSVGVKLPNAKLLRLLRIGVSSPTSACALVRRGLRRWLPCSTADVVGSVLVTSLPDAHAAQSPKPHCKRELSRLSRSLHLPLSVSVSVSVSMVHICVDTASGPAVLFAQGPAEAPGGCLLSRVPCVQRLLDSTCCRVDLRNLR